MKQAHIIMTGFVQGVGFRQFLKKEAKKRALFGWVKNVDHDKVEALLQGSEAMIEQLILLCRKGPFLAQVRDVHVVWEEQKQAYDDFVVLS